MCLRRTDIAKQLAPRSFPRWAGSYNFPVIFSLITILLLLDPHKVSGWTREVGWSHRKMQGNKYFQDIGRIFCCCSRVNPVVCINKPRLGGMEHFDTRATGVYEASKKSFCFTTRFQPNSSHIEVAMDLFDHFKSPETWTSFIDFIISNTTVASQIQDVFDRFKNGSVTADNLLVFVREGFANITMVN